MKSILLACGCAAFLSTIADEAIPQNINETVASPWVQNHKISVRLISNTESIGKSDTVDLGLHFKMEPGWRIYWRNPTGFSFHPRIDTRGSENLRSAKISWPVPTQIPVYGHLTLGYQNEVVLPVKAKVQQNGKNMIFKAKLNYLACSDICIPSKASFDMRFGPDDLKKKPFSKLISRFDQLVPKAASDDEVRFEQIEAGASDKTVVKIVARSNRPFQKPELVVGGPEYAEFFQSRVKLEDNNHRAIFEVPATIIPAEKLQGKKLTAILVDHDRRLIEQVTVAEEPTPEGFWSKLKSKLIDLLPSREIDQRSSLQNNQYQ